MNIWKKYVEAISSLKIYEVIMYIALVWILCYLTINIEGVSGAKLILFLGGICSISSVFLTANLNRVSIPFSIMQTVITSIFLYIIEMKVIAILTFIVFLSLDIFTWIKWNKNKSKKNELLVEPRTLSDMELLTILVLGIGYFLVFSIFIQYFVPLISPTKGYLPILILCIILDIVARVFKSFRYAECYIFRVTLDVIFLCLSASIGSIALLLYSILIFFEDVIGIGKWLKKVVSSDDDTHYTIHGRIA